jgi:periplasmic protein TonB
MMTPQLLTLSQGTKPQDTKSDLYRSALLAGVLHALALFSVVSTAHFASNIEQNELNAITASFQPSPSASVSLEKPAKPNKVVQSKPATPVAQTSVPIPVSKTVAEQAVFSTPMPEAQVVATTTAATTPAPAQLQAAAQTQKSVAPAVASAALVNTPAIFDAAYLNNPPPQYPSVSRLRGETGTTMLHVQISAEGKALEVNVSKSSGSGKLDQAAVNAVMRWRFVPAKRGAIATASWVTIPIEYTLNQ